jgi:ligand-binding sensor domain-containing protein
MWFGTDHGISRYDGKNWRTYTTNDGLASNNIWVITQDNQDNLWFGTNDGVSCYDGSRWRTFTNKDGLAGNNVGAIAQDNKGNLWFGTKGGVSRYDGSNWSTFTHEDGLPYLGSYGAITAIFLDNKCNLWFAAQDGGVSRYDGTTWQAFTIGTRPKATDPMAMPGPLPSVEAIAQDKQGNLWFGTNGGGVTRYDGTTWKTFTSKDGLAGNSISAILTDKQGNVWFATTWHSMPKVEATYPADYPASPPSINVIESSTSPSSSAAVSCYDGTNWRTFNWEDGLLGIYANAIEEDNQGNIWVGTGTVGGVSYYDGTAWRTFTTRDGLADGDVRAVFKDRQGNLWFGTNGGVSRYSPAR